ncbi:MAG: uncharacterized protein A8A55_2797 [Amphiamblys sp. WSBS2006]|nr:MAG: uncharacterized protein A8A55_2797 [Amphiamblys sp. WSBS2006]
MHKQLSGEWLEGPNAHLVHGRPGHRRHRAKWSGTTGAERKTGALYTEEARWKRRVVDALSRAGRSYNRARHSSHRKTPYEKSFGRKPTCSYAVMVEQAEVFHDVTEETADSDSLWYDLRQIRDSPAPILYITGETVAFFEDFDRNRKLPPGLPTGGVVYRITSTTSAVV